MRPHAVGIFTTLLLPVSNTLRRIPTQLPQGKDCLYHWRHCFNFGLVQIERQHSRSFLNHLMSMLPFTLFSFFRLADTSMSCSQPADNCAVSHTGVCCTGVFLNCCHIQVSACLLLSIITLTPSLHSFPVCFWSQEHFFSNKIAKGSCWKEPGLAGR